MRSLLFLTILLFAIAAPAQDFTGAGPKPVPWGVLLPQVTKVVPPPITVTPPEILVTTNAAPMNCDAGCVDGVINAQTVEYLCLRLFQLSSRLAGPVTMPTGKPAYKCVVNTDTPASPGAIARIEQHEDKLIGLAMPALATRAVLVVNGSFGIPGSPVPISKGAFVWQIAAVAPGAKGGYSASIQDAAGKELLKLTGSFIAPITAIQRGKVEYNDATGVFTITVVPPLTRVELLIDGKTSTPWYFGTKDAVNNIATFQLSPAARDGLKHYIDVRLYHSRASGIGGVFRADAHPVNMVLPRPPTAEGIIK